MKEVLTEKQAQEFRKQMKDTKDTKCSYCDTELKDEPIRYYTPLKHGWICVGIWESDIATLSDKEIGEKLIGLSGN